MIKRTLLLAGAIVLFSAADSSAQFACPYSRTNGVFSVAQNPRNFCPLVLQGREVMDVQASLAQFAFFTSFQASGSFSGDLGSIIDDGTFPPVTSFGCTLLDMDLPGRQSHLRFLTRYSPGIHTVKASFTRCENGQKFEATVIIVVGTTVLQEPQTCQPQLVDPATLLLRGPSIPTNTDGLARSGTTVRGVAADGLTRAVVRIPTNAVGDSVGITVIDDQGAVSSSPDFDGGLTALGADAGPGSSGFSTVSVATREGPRAFAVLQAPVNFSRGLQDDWTPSREIKLRVECPSTRGRGVTETDVTIQRPPVVLIHGIWSDKGAWDTFTPQDSSRAALWSRLAPAKVDYSRPVPTLTGSVPFYLYLGNVKANSLGFEYNAPSVLDQVRTAIRAFRSRHNVAAASADVVAHSMGGDISRTMALLPEFKSHDTFGRGPIHKLITIATPHLGTPVALKMLDPQNTCLQTTFRYAGLVPLEAAVVGGFFKQGALGDLRGDGFGGQLSDALAALQDPPPFPTAYIAGTTTQQNLRDLNCLVCSPGISRFVRDLCGSWVGSSPLALAMTPERWDLEVFSQPNDGIVPLRSQVNGGGNGSIFSGLIHTTALTALDFHGPAVLEGVSGIPDKVVELLNEKSDGPHFQRSVP